jgi:YhcH/YjgK/YiaL family protein
VPFTGRAMIAVVADLQVELRASAHSIPAMAFFGPLATVRARCARFPEFHAAFLFAGEALTPGSAVFARIMGLLDGSTHRVELPGDAYVVEMVYQTKPRPEGFFETHRRFIDVQVIVAGEELMEVTDAARLRVAKAYDAKKDFTKYASTAEASVLRMRTGDVAIFWPEDAHMPSLALKEPGLVRKAVVKVPVG